MKTIRTDPDNSRYRVASVSPELMVARNPFSDDGPCVNRDPRARGDEQIRGTYHFSDLEREIRFDREGRGEIYHYVVRLMVSS